MRKQLLWNSPPIPERLIDDESRLWAVRAKVDELSASDSPSSSDMSALFWRYNESSPAERDAIDAAFVWLTGYTLATICAMEVTPKGKDYEATLKKWERQARGK